MDGKLGRGVCVCERVQEVLRAKEGMCSERGQRKESVLPFLTRVGTRAREWKGNVFVNVSAGAGTKANARAAAHLRLVIFVSLRMAASTEAPLALM